MNPAIQNAKRIIIKVGSSLVTNDGHGLDLAAVATWAKQIAELHTQGKEIYWQYQNYAPREAYYIGQKFAKVSGYSLANVPYESSFAGYKDWFLQEFKRPAYTIEAGVGESPLPLSQFNQIYNDNIGILILGAVL